MGTIAGDTRPGLIYLHQNTSKEFTESLAKTDHKTPDTFLNELIDVFVKNEHTQALQVNWDLAFKFLALLSGTQFGNCNDLMKHLLGLYSQSQTSKTKITQNIPQERSSNRKRKSQPRRNIKSSELTEEDADIIIDAAAEDNWVEKSGKSEVVNSSTPTVDLSVVKQEKPDEVENVQNKDQDKNKRGMGLMLQKTQSTRDSRALDALYLRKYESQLRMKQRLLPKENVEPLLNLNKNRFKPKTTPFHLPHTNRNELMINASHRFSIMNQMSGLEKKPTDADDDNYTYVLNSLDSPAIDNGQNNNGLPRHSMHVPIKYPKSSPYEVSSDEERPHDLSYTNEQPQNLTVAKNESIQAKKEHVIKYDKNGNALPELVSLASPQSKRYPTPSNLFFNDLHAYNNGLIGEPQLLTSPSSDKKQVKMTSNGLIGPVAVSLDGKKMVENHNAMTPVGPVSFQVVLPQSQQQMYIPNQLMSPSQAFPGMPLLMAVGSPEQVAAQQAQKIAQGDGSLSDPNRDSGSELSGSGSLDSRKKRKKMDDTTSFRDPPETSLPFNGPNKYRFYCDVCDTGFTRRYTFNRHKCKGRVEKHYCQLCDKAYLSKYKLKDHILVKHEGQTVSCPDCGKQFSSRSSMEMHKKQQHEGQFSIWCKVCGKGFNHTGHYYGHMNKHTNTKPFWCQQCGKRFYGSSYLHNHKQVCRGNNDLNYNCNLCDRKFKCELYLKKHMKIHDSSSFTGNKMLDSGPFMGDPDAMGMSDSNNSPVEMTLAKSNDLTDAHQDMDMKMFPLTGGSIFPNGPDATPSAGSVFPNGPEVSPSEGSVFQNGPDIAPKGGSVFPNGPDTLDSSSNPDMLIIDEAKAMGEENKGKLDDSGAMLEASSEGKT